MAAGNPPWVVILGAGYAGLSLAVELDEYLDDHPKAMQIVLVDQNHELTVSTANQFALAGRSKPEEVTNSYQNVSLKHAFYVQDRVVSINPERREVHGRGHRFRYDILVLALGSDKEKTKVQNLPESAYDLGDMKDTMQLKDAMADFRGGNVVISLCHPNPSGMTAAYEFAFVIMSLVHKKARVIPDILDHATVVLTVPNTDAFTRQALAALEYRMEEQGITFRTGVKPFFVAPKDRAIFFDDGAQLAYDILVTHYPPKPPRVLVDSKLCPPDSFVPTNVYTLRTEHPNVYCIGDCAELKSPGSSLPFPKTSALAVQQARTVANDIIDRLEDGVDLRGRWNPKSGRKQTGVAEFHIEAGRNEAMRVKLDYFNVDVAREDTVTISEASHHHMRELIQWWDDQTVKWFVQ